MYTAILHYGTGNVLSLANMFEALGCPVVLADNEDTIKNAGRLLLPGVGAFDPAMQRLRQLGWDALLRREVLEKGKPLLGVCLGFQMLFESSEEGQEAGLGILQGRVKSLRSVVPSHLPVPHIGWNYVYQEKRGGLLEGLEEVPRFYFAHSYFVQPYHVEDIWLTVEYGVRFVCGVQRAQIWGVQFHPERSHRFGMTVLKNFSRI
jgi:glutamine amidotransferase